MHLDLTSDQASELALLLDSALGDMSHEIASTDNYEYRAELKERREVIKSVRGQLGSAS